MVRWDDCVVVGMVLGQGLKSFHINQNELLKLRWRNVNTQIDMLPFISSRLRLYSSFLGKTKYVLLSKCLYTGKKVNLRRRFTSVWVWYDLEPADGNETNYVWGLWETLYLLLRWGDIGVLYRVYEWRFSVMAS